MALTDLTPNPNNARRHALDRDVPILMESLRVYGQQKPIVAKRAYRGLENVVLAGNGTRLAAEQLGWSHLAVTWFDGSDEDADDFALVDNRTAELSEWDLEALASQLKAVRDRGGDDAITRMGWSEHEAAPLLAAEWTPSAGHASIPAREVTYRSVSLSLGQWLVLELAIQRMQQRETDPSMPEGRCVELMAADFLGGAPQEGT